MCSDLLGTTDLILLLLKKNCISMLGETLCILKPLIYLATRYLKGEESWLPWTTALSIGIFNLIIISNEESDEKYTLDQEKEINKRSLSILLYILRPPCFKKFVEKKFDHFVKNVCPSVPLGKFIAKIIINRSMHVRKSYFYIWSC
ncbi:Similar to PEX16: Peroxisome biogenesis protein 16 (Arabidopsis thaliana) [Cotesia congregata]|uniref:Peroxisomal membrane protein PEX16 n=1 Tax=Cotesia congregata TaxID=51543 RepID=A0A8J2H3C2_COTCN|nr:Similar to PEX16: Peroxisome biogenesis protein 16 (Arabidopsis thaliana) [Cotesia congregata]